MIKLGETVSQGLTDQQIAQFHADGFLIVRGCLPAASIQPLIVELKAKVDDLANQAVEKGILEPQDRFPEAPFETRLSLVCNASADKKRTYRPPGHCRGRPPHG